VSRRDERGQLVLVTAVAIAALLVLVAVLLNSVVYTENVATRDTTADDARAAQLYRVAAVEAVAGITERANRDGASPAEFRGNVTKWGDLRARHAALSGASARVTVVSAPNGTRIFQANATRAFTNASGASSWQLAAGIETVENWRMVVNETSLVTVSSPTTPTPEADGAFHVTVTDGSAIWRAFVYHDGTDVVVQVEENGALGPPCPVPTENGTATVQLASDATCSSLDFEGVVGAPFDISYGDGSNATGTYSLVVDQYRDDVIDGDFATDGGSPSLAYHFSDVHIDITYTTANLEYVARNVNVDAEVDS
jgi:hypothetical protein